MTTFFTSDLHFGHANIQSYCPTRPGTTVPEMNEILIDNWNDTVGRDDTVWVLGDVAMGKIAESLPLVKRLRGTKLLIPGNHDRCWYPFGRKVAQWTPKYEEVGFTVFNDRERMRIGEWDGFPLVKMSHLPYDGDHTEEDRYLDQRPTDEGHILLHGHVHDGWKLKMSASGTPQINVGVDVWDYRPVALETLIALV